MSAKPMPVILLEDDAVLRELWVDGLNAAGYAVVETATVAQAASALQEAGGRAVFVADRAVDPGALNGFQFAAEALDRYEALRVIYITGTHIAIRRRTLGERERALMKPFAIAQLLAAVRELST